MEAFYYKKDGTDRRFEEDVLCLIIVKHTGIHVPYGMSRKMQTETHER